MPTAATAAPAPDAPEKLPGLVGIWIGIVVVVVGIIAGIVLVVVGAKSFVDGFGDLQRVPTATGGTIRLDSTGAQNIYAERFTGQSGSSFNTSSYGGFRPAINVEIVDPDGNAVYVTTPQGSETYVSNGREGVRIGRFIATQVGDYRIRALASDGASGYSTIAVGSGIDVGGVVGILGGVFGGGLIVVLGIVIIIISSVRRGRARRAQALAGRGPYGGAPLPGWAPAPVPGPAYGPGPGGYPPAAPGFPPAAGPSSASPSATPGWAPPPLPTAPPPAPWGEPSSDPGGPSDLGGPPP